MSAEIQIYVGAPIEIGSERAFLSRLCADLLAKGTSALIFANFHLPSRNPIHQIDFLIVLDQVVSHVELKNLTAPVFGTANGRWQIQLPDGKLKDYDGKNPFVQSLDCKMAISDQMRVFANAKRNVAPPPAGKKYFQTIESVICVFPELMPGSQVPNNGKVRALGYPQFLSFLEATRRTPGWSTADWIDFAVDLGLMRTSLSGEPDKATTDAIDLVADYERRFEDFYSRELPPLISTSVEIDGVSHDSRELVDIANLGVHAQVIGSSGSGKSHHLVHMAVSALKGGRLPIILRASEYSGRLSQLLDRSVAHACPCTAVQLMAAAKSIGRSIQLFVDGFNECPAPLQSSLLKDLQALYLRGAAPITISTQEPIALPESLRGKNIEFGVLKEGERRAILEWYAAGSLPEHADEMCRPFLSAYELSLAAGCIAEVATRPTRVGLFDAFCRRRCLGKIDYALASRILSRIADVMREQLRSRLAVAEVWRIGEEILDSQHAPLVTLSQLMACGILEIRQGFCSFRHELLQRYFEAVTVRRIANDAETLGAVLRKPVNRELIEFVLAMHDDPVAICACLEAATDVGIGTELLLNCLRDRFGPERREIAMKDARNILHDAAEELASIDLLLRREAESYRQFSVEVVNARKWTAYDMAVMSAIGEMVFDGLFVPETFRLLADTENRCRSILGARIGDRINKPGFKSDLFWNMVVMSSTAGVLPAIVILQTIDKRFRGRTQPDVVELASKALEDLQRLSVFEIYAMLCLLKGSSGRFEKLVPSILEFCWAEGVYHLQLKVLDCLRSWASGFECENFLSAETREKIIEFLPQLQSDNVFLNTTVIETMLVFDMIEPPVGTDIRQQLSVLLQSPDDAEAQADAYHAVSNMFEEVYQGAYCEAIDELTQDDRIRLYTMAALAVPSYSISSDYVLAELLKTNDERSLPAFKRFALELDGESMCPQDTTQCFLLAHVGCARFLAEPLQLQDQSNDDRRAWQCYGEIFFWISKTELPLEERKIRCAALWKTLEEELPLQAVDPLVRFGAATRMHYRDKQDPPVHKFFSLFQTELRRILEFGLRHREKITSIDKRIKGEHLLREQTVFMIHTLGQIGQPETVPVLSPFLDDAYYGRDAVEAIRRVHEQRPFEKLAVTTRWP